MFTGLVERVGRVRDVSAAASGHALAIETTLATELCAGESIAVNGVCLTVTHVDADVFGADIGAETARVTTLDAVRPGTPVNLERALRADARLGGHFVLGHVDATGMIEDVRHDGDTHWVTIGFPDHLTPLLVHKGSVTVDGISLTIAEISERRFVVMIVPFTWAHTQVSTVTVGDRVNLEADVLGKYVVRAFEVYGAARLDGRSTSEAMTR